MSSGPPLLLLDAAAPALPDGGFDEDDGALMHCHVCGVRFFDPIGLRQHVASHSRPKLSNKACEQCGEQFPLQRLLKEHLIKVHRAMPHVCDVCGKGFKIRMDMMRHKTTHTDERAHVCPVCQLGFNRKFTLTTHMRMHTGEAPYECPDCGIRFKQNSALRYHNRRNRCQSRAGYVPPQLPILNLRKRFLPAKPEGWVPLPPPAAAPAPAPAAASSPPSSPSALSAASPPCPSPSGVRAV